MRSVQRDGLPAAVLAWERIGLITLAAALCSAKPTSARADYEGEPFRSVTLTCSFTDYQTFAFESAEVRATSDEKDQAAGSKTFRSGEKDVSVNFRVRPGESAECVFPSGHRVRIKTGEGIARPYGMCGGNPEIFSSIWVNRRKIASREWFGGHCRESSHVPDLSYKMSLSRAFIEKCHTAVQAEDDPPTSEDSRTPLSVCVDIPELSRYPLDSLEYPPKGEKRSAVGSVKVLQGQEAVCSAGRQLLGRDFQFGGDSAKALGIVFPDSQQSRLSLPEELGHAYQSRFDLDNDGQEDLVLERPFETHYLHGDTLLFKTEDAQPPITPEELTMDSWTFYPCQLFSANTAIPSCPPFSQAHDDANFVVGSGKNRTVFRGRYTHLTPFRYHGTSYLAVTSESEDTMSRAAIIKPLPNKRWAPVCLFRRVEENF